MLTSKDCAKYFPALTMFALAVALANAQKAPIQITADLSDAPRKLYHAEIDLPVSAGPIDADYAGVDSGAPYAVGAGVFDFGRGVYRQWKTLEWRRDDVNLYRVSPDGSGGVTTLHAHLDCIVTRRVSQQMAVLEWEKLLLYPAHVPVKDIPIQPSVKVPAGWGIGTALTPVERWMLTRFPAAGSTTKFAATTVEQLEDSPIIDGAVFPRVSRWRRRFRRSTTWTWWRTSRRMRTCGRRCWPKWPTWCARPTRCTPRTITTSTTFC